MRILALALLFILGTAPAVLAQDSAEEDKGFLTTYLQDNLSGAGRDVQINGFAGALSAQASIQDMTIADDQGVWLRLEGVKLDWDRSALFGGRVDVTELTAQRITLSRLPEAQPSEITPEAQPFSLPDLPVSIEIGSLRAEELVLGASILGQPVGLSASGQLQLDGGEGRANLRATRTDGQEGTITLSASYANGTNQIDLAFLLSEGAGGIAGGLMGLPGDPSVRLTLDGSGTSQNLAAKLALDTDDTPRLAGTFTLASPSDAPGTFAADLDVSGDVTALFLPDYQEFFGPEVALRSRLIRDADGSTQLTGLTLVARSLTLGGAAQLDQNYWPETFDLTGTLANPAGGPVLLPVGGAETRIGHANLAVTFDSSKGDTWQLSLDGDALSRPGLTVDEFTLDGGGLIRAKSDSEPGLVSAGLQYSAAGVGFDDGGLSNALGDEMTGELRVVRLQGMPTVIDRLTLNGPGITLDASARIAPQSDGFETDTVVHLVTEDMARFATLLARPIAGSADATVVAKYAPMTNAMSAFVVAQTTDLRLGVERLDPLLTGKTQLSFLAERDAEGSRLSGLTLQGEAVTAEADISLSSGASSGTLVLSITDAALIEPSLTGPIQLAASGHQGLDGAGEIRADITLNQDRLTAETELAVGGFDAPLVINATGQVLDLAQYASVSGRDLAGSAELSLQGSALSDGSEFDVSFEATGQDLRAGIDIADRLLQGLAKASGRISRTGPSDFAVDGFVLEAPLVTVTADVTPTGNGASNAQFDLALADLGVLTPELSGPATAQGTAQRSAAGDWTLNVDGSGAGGISLAASGTAAASGDLNIDLNGQAPLALINAQIAPRSLEGVARFDLRVAGPPALASVSGTVSTSSARLSAPTLGQSIEGLDVTVNLAQGRAQLAGQGQMSGGGTLAVDGTTNLSAPYSADISIGLNQIGLRDPVLYETSVSGDLRLSGPLAGGASVTGNLLLGETQVRVPSSSVGFLGELPVVRHTGTPGAVAQTLARAGLTQSGSDSQSEGRSGPSYPLDIIVSAPSRIFIRGRGLDAELGGTLSLQGTTGNLIPLGQFDLVRGRLDILQQRFDLTEGYASIEGDFIPFVRLLATTTARTGTVINVAVEGPVSEPDVLFTSSPELPQDEVLAQLIFGRDISQISALQAVQLASAINTLAGRGGAGVVDNLRAGAGLDDLDVSASEDGTAEVRAGKYLTENIYTDLTVSSNGSTEINLNLDLTDEFTAKGSFGTSGESSLGVFFEKDY